MARALVNVPRTVRKGEIFEIKALVSHPMESGYRVGMNGTIIPRDIVQQFACAYNGVAIFRAQLSPAVAANPFISFHAVALESGRLTFHWTGDNGFDVSESAEITVE